MGKRAVVPVDFSKVDEILKNLNMTDNELSIGLGHDKGYFRHVRERGMFTKTDALLFLTKYGVDVEKKEEPAPIKDTDPSNHTETSNDIVAQLVDTNNTLINMIDSLDRNVEDIKGLLCQILEKLS